MANRRARYSRRRPVAGRWLAALLVLMALSAVSSPVARAGSGVTCFRGLHYSTKKVGCSPHSSGMTPAPGGLALPPGGIPWWDCVEQLEFFTLNEQYNWGIDPAYIHQSLFWLLYLTLDNAGNLSLLDSMPHSGACQAAPPPPPSNPVIYLAFDSILAVVPEAFWSGTADCPAGEPSSDACPPSVGNPIDIWISQFASAAGQQSQQCSKVLSPFLNLASYQACLRWNRVGSIVWDFDDETVDGVRVPGRNYNVVEVGTGEASAISHTFEYSSGFDPLRNCLRPCPGDALGPDLPGHPGGSPAFQVTVSTVWEVQLQECFSTGGPRICTPWRFIDLRTLGAATADFTSTSLIPIPVVEYGASPP